MTWRASVLTLFPAMFPGPLGQSLAGRALETGLWSLVVTNIRDFAQDRHRTVDDTPFGGGAGMVLRPDIVDAAVAAVADDRPVICLTPRGRRFSQQDAKRFAAGPGLILLCGRYEGVDQRVIEARAMDEISIGDYVLSGGEPSAARRHGRPRQRHRGEFLPRPAGIPALHPPRRVAGTPRAGRAAVRPSRRRRRVAVG
jgi:tRNA (guanine37-N1)-methyltransferase